MNTLPDRSLGRTLVIPDIHNAFARADAFIQRLAGRFDRIVFLGDYFDDFGDTPDIVLGVAKWLQHSIEQPNRIHLVGNHDLAYLRPGPFTWCSGFEPDKLRAIAPVLNRLPRDQFHAAVEIDGWLLSHAGFLPCYVSGHSAVSVAVWADCLLRQLFAGGWPSLFAAGAARGGRAPVGGITWCDWEREFLPTEGIHQIVGHTPARTVRFSALRPPEAVLYRRSFDQDAMAGLVLSCDGHDSLNVCLDTGLRCVALIDAGKLTVVADSELGITAAPSSISAPT